MATAVGVLVVEGTVQYYFVRDANFVYAVIVIDHLGFLVHVPDAPIGFN